MPAGKMAIALGLACLLAGCAANPMMADRQGRVLLEDEGLAHAIRVLQQNSDRIAGDLLRVRTQIKNDKKEELWVDVQMIWKDAEGYEVYRTNWAPLLLPGRFTTHHEIASLRPDVADYELRIRRPLRTISGR